MKALSTSFFHVTQTHIQKKVRRIEFVSLGRKIPHDWRRRDFPAPTRKWDYGEIVQHQHQDALQKEKVASLAPPQGTFKFNHHPPTPEKLRLVSFSRGIFPEKGRPCNMHLT